MKFRYFYEGDAQTAVPSAEMADIILPLLFRELGLAPPHIGREDGKIIIGAAAQEDGPHWIFREDDLADHGQSGFVLSRPGQEDVAVSPVTRDELGDFMVTPLLRLAEQKGATEQADEFLDNIRLAQMSVILNSPREKKNRLRRPAPELVRFRPAFA